MTFESDVKEMYEIYLDTERQFIELSYVIPLDNEPETYSPRLYSILQMACSQAETMLRLLCEKLQLKPVNNNFPSYFEQLNVKGMLTRQKIVLRKKKIIQPFIITTNESPVWWQGYNDTKHDLPSGIKQGSIGNTINALAGVCALHQIPYFAGQNPQTLLMQENWYDTALPQDPENAILADYLLGHVPLSHTNALFLGVTTWTGQHEPTLDKKNSEPLT